MVTLKDAKRISKLLNVDEKIVKPERLLVGIKIEMEHGNIDPSLNVTNDDLVETAKIALAHFKENPGSKKYGDYYHQLERMEKDADKFWKGKNKPDVLYIPLWDLVEIIQN